MAELTHNSILERIPDIFFQLDEEGKVLYLNEAWETCTGIPKDKMKGASILDHIPDRERDELENAIQEVRKGGVASRELAIRFLEEKGNSDLFHLLLKSSPGNGESMLIEGVARRKGTEQEFSEDEKGDPILQLFREEWDSRLALFPEASPFPLLECDLEGELLYLNPEAFKLLNEKGVKNRFDFLPDQHRAIVDHVARTGREVQREVTYEGQVYLWFYSLPKKGRELLHIRGQDVSEQKRVEGDLLDAIVRTQEEEREHFATELHEDINQKLSATLMRFEDLVSELGLEQKDKSTEIQKLLSGSIQDVRKISQGLMPRMLKEFGLVAALEDLRQRISERHQVQVEMEISTRETTIEGRIKVGIYRLVHELIVFASRVRGVRNCWVQIWEDEKAFFMTFSDEGASKDPSTGGSFKDLRKFNSMVRSMHGAFDLRYGENGRPYVWIMVPLQ